jgi:hypothetical protein
MPPRFASSTVALAALTLWGCGSDDGPAAELLGAGHDVESPDPGTGRLEVGGEVFDFEVEGCRVEVSVDDTGRSLELALGGPGQRDDGREHLVGVNRTADDYEGVPTHEGEHINVLIAAEPGTAVDGEVAPAALAFGHTGTLEDRTQGDQPAVRADEDGLITARDVALEVERDGPGLDGVEGGEASLVARCHADDVRLDTG